jgi:hypothetical protein
MVVGDISQSRGWEEREEKKRKREDQAGHGSEVDGIPGRKVAAIP